MAASAPFAYIAHKGGRWAGLCAAQGVSKKLVREFFADFAGFDITTVYSREEYNTKLDTLKMWKSRKKQKELPL